MPSLLLFSHFSDEVTEVQREAQSMAELKSESKGLTPKTMFFFFFIVFVFIYLFDCVGS